MVFKKAISRSAFQKFESIFIVHAFWQSHEHVHVVRHHGNQMDFDLMPESCFADAGFRKVFVLEPCEHLITVLGLYRYVPKIYADFVAVMFQFNVYVFHFRCSAQRKLTLNQREIERAKISLHAQFFIKMVEKTYGGRQGNSSTRKACSILA